LDAAARAAGGGVMRYRVWNSMNGQTFEVRGLTRGICRIRAYARCRELNWPLDVCWSERL